ncbi:hypothetical protein [Polymorphospora sp. NPDC050346]|uniref:hypothetical protein n=1 Tax=Polymorphospora sp. NPDC050346 TaxID=3155780 RepID=UPI0033DA3F50
MPSRAAVVLAILIAGATAAAVPASADDGRIGIRLLEAPVDRRDDPRARVYVIDHLNPGTKIERRIEVANNAPTPRTIELYPAGAAIEDDAFTIAEDRTANELSGWISLDRPSVDLDPYSRTTVLATVDVPAAAARGERYAVVWAQASAPTGSPGAGNVGVVHRVGIRVYLDVGPGGEPPSSFEIGDLTASRRPDGVPTITADVRNTGERALDLSGSLNLADGPGAMRAGPYPVTLGTTLAPGTAGQVVVELDARLPDGPWTAELTLASGLLKETSTVTLTLPPPGASTRATAGDGRPFLGWTLVGVAVVALVAAGLLAVRHRDRIAARRPRARRASAGVRPAGRTRP